jgi:prepilin-type N-terminal cleavage/methylation domain-containing protein
MHLFRPTKRPRRGMSLLEPLTVLVIIGLLAAGAATGARAFLIRAGDVRALDDVLTVARLAEAQAERGRRATYEYPDDFLNDRLTLTFEPAKTRRELSVALTHGGSRATIALVTDRRRCVVAYLERGQEPRAVVAGDVSVSGDDCDAGELSTSFLERTRR